MRSGAAADLLAEAQRLRFPFVPWREGAISGMGAWRAAVAEATPKELQMLREQLRRHQSLGDDAPLRRSAPRAATAAAAATVSGPADRSRISRRTVTRLADGKTTETITEDLAPPQIQIIRIPKHEPAEWERERDELRAKVATLEADVRSLATSPAPPVAASPRALVSTPSYQCWRVIAGLVAAASGATRVVHLDFGILDRELGQGQSSLAARRIMLADLAKEARADEPFWRAYPDLRELRFEEVAPAAALVPANQPLSTAPAPAVRVASPIGFRP